MMKYFISGRRVPFLMVALMGLSAALIAFAPPPAMAKATPKALTAAQKTDAVQKAEDYLRTLGTAKSRFLQTTNDGTQLLGTFYLSRPGKLRFEYDDPVKDFIVADGIFIYFYDAQLGEQSNAPIGQTLADFLLRRELRLSGDVSVTDVREGGGLLQITLAQSGDTAAGTLMLGFQQHPFALKKWRVTDATGAITEVELFDLETGLNLPNRLFIYRAPAPRTPRYN